VSGIRGTPPRPGSVTLARGLLAATLTWNVVEGLVAVAAGIIAGSVALVGFGLDSSIEVTAAAILLWRVSLPEDDERAETRERAADRVIGATFIALAIYIIAQTAYVLASDSEPETSGVGIVLAIASLAVMPVLGLVKRHNATLLASRALIAESTETLICSYLSLTLFIGLSANALFGWWWSDVAAALAMTPWIVKEGIEGLRGDEQDD
jgi:divalent metal cation (Fe/Co/Zn/Cd) transporter